jgi:hypothetical protein
MLVHFSLACRSWLAPLARDLIGFAFALTQQVHFCLCSSFLASTLGATFWPGFEDFLSFAPCFEVFRLFGHHFVLLFLASMRLRLPATLVILFHCCFFRSFKANSNYDRPQHFYFVIFSMNFAIF